MLFTPKYFIVIFGYLFIFGILSPQLVFGAIQNIPVPFTSQAPEGIWKQPWQDACEEAAIVMIDAYYTGNTVNALETHTAKEAILNAYQIKTNHFGYSLDESAHTIAEWINLFFPWEARVVNRPTIATMLAEIDAGRPIILPAYGKKLNNPHFSNPLLDYHVVVLKGYDTETQEFIVHDPGTASGLDFRYSFATIESAMHDFEPGNMPRARKVAIFTSPTITDRSAYTDGDKDGATKVQELIYGTSLHRADTDTDGYLDGVEIYAGYDPKTTIPTPIRHILVQPISRPEVYILFKGTKSHIPDPAAFRRAGYRWQDIRLIRDDIFSYIASIPF
jgi:hypothetical protein